MVSLVDIGPMTDKVTIEGKGDVPVSGITAAHIVGIFYQFPDIRKLLTQQALDSDIITSLVTDFPQAVGGIIAAATGHPDEQPHIEAAVALPIGLQYQFLEKIVPMTFPQGVANFLDAVQKLVRQAEGRGWVPGTKSPAPSSAASQQDGGNAIAGTQLQDS